MSSIYPEVGIDRPMPTPRLSQLGGGLVEGFGGQLVAVVGIVAADRACLGRGVLPR